MSHFFDELQIKVTKENKKEIDRKIHDLVGVDYKNCSTTWKSIKTKLAENEEALLADLDAKLSKFQQPELDMD